LSGRYWIRTGDLYDRVGSQRVTLASTFPTAPLRTGRTPFSVSGSPKASSLSHRNHRKRTINKATDIVQRCASSYVRPVFLPFYPVGEFIGPATDDCAFPLCEIIGRVARRRRACRTKPESHQRMVLHNPYDSAFFPKPSAPGEQAQRQTEVPVIGALSRSVVQVPLPLGSGFRGSYIRSFSDRPSYSPRWILLWQDVHTGTCFLFRAAITRKNPFKPLLVKPCLTYRT
jgi:hypothetical protein